VRRTCEVRRTFGDVQRARVVHHRFGVGVHARGGIAGQCEIFQRAPIVARLVEVLPQQRREFVRSEPIGIHALQRLAHSPMQSYAIKLYQRTIRRILYQRVSEQVFDLRLHGDQAKQAGGFKCGKMVDEGHAGSTLER